MDDDKKRLVVGISGASGAPIAIELLKALKWTDIRVHLMISAGAKMTIAYECEESLDEIKKCAMDITNWRKPGRARPVEAGNAWGCLLCPAV